jgi:prolyl-tRNA synthetase
MRQSQLFTKTTKETPKDEISRNAQLLLRAGFIYKEMAGTYGFLPLGLRVLEKIKQVIREEMNILDAQEITMSSLQNKETWEPTNQWDDEQVDVWFKTKLKNETELGLAFSHEAAMTKMMKNFIQSYRDLPKLVYQFQTKFRNEVRAKSGIMRTREFVMKDMYSFARNEQEHVDIYEKTKEAYTKIFNRLGIGDKTFITFALGGLFSKYSHEFQALTETGEDTIYVNEEKKIALNQEVYTPEVLEELGVKESELIEKKSSEVGNIFNLRTRFSDALDLTFLDENGVKQKVIMGSYGIGPARVMGTIVETLADDRGIIWPENITPFTIHLLVLGNNEAVIAAAETAYIQFQKQNIEVLFDDRSETSNGEKFSDADLIGCPWRVVVSEKSLQAGGLEIKNRKEEKSEVLDLNSLIARIQ